MCEQLIKLWIEDVDSSHLFEYYDAERVVIERQINKEKFGTENPVPTLFPHEFLFLCCNCQNRKELVKYIYEILQLDATSSKEKNVRLQR
jgi:hypothetical protein